MSPLAKILTKQAVLLILALITPLAFAAGDYVWEAKFAKELPKAEQGIVKSQYAIGEMYEKGKGTEPDTTKAFKWYVKAAGKGRSLSQGEAEQRKNSRVESHLLIRITLIIHGGMSIYCYACIEEFYIPIWP